MGLFRQHDSKTGIIMGHDLIEGILLPTALERVTANVEHGTALYRLVIGQITLAISETSSAVHATFSQVGQSTDARYDISEIYQNDKLSSLRSLIAAAYFQHCKLSVDPDLEFSKLDDNVLVLEQFSRDISDAIPDAVCEEDLVHNEGDEGQASGIHYFILKEDACEVDTYCFIELGVFMPSYCDDNYDANVSLFVMPNLDELAKNQLIRARRKQYISRYLYDFERLLTDFADETLSLLGERLSKANMLSLSERLAERAAEWQYLSTRDALANACPDLVTIEIVTDQEYNDAGDYFCVLSNITFSSHDDKYQFGYDYEGFAADADLLDEDGNFGGLEFDVLKSILGAGFEEDEVFGLVETMSSLMMRMGRTSESLRSVPEAVVA